MINIATTKKDFPSNIYTNALARSFKWHNKIFGTTPTNKDWENLFGKRKGKFISSVDDLNLAEARSTAIILLGLSGCGKSTYTKTFLSKYSNFTPCKYDNIEAQFVAECLEKGVLVDEELADAYGAYEFGNILEQYKRQKKNIIIDGLWISPTARGALLHALRQIGYKNIFIFSFLNIPDSEVFKMLSLRAMRNTIIKDFSHGDKFLFAKTAISTMDDSLPELFNLTDKSIDELRNSLTFKKEYQSLIFEYFYNEPLEHDLSVQKAHQVFHYGSDYYVELFNT